MQNAQIGDILIAILTITLIAFSIFTVSLLFVITEAHLSEIRSRKDVNIPCQK